MPKRFYEFDTVNLELSEATDKTLMDEVVHAAEVSAFFEKDAVGMALLSDVKTKAFEAFHQITRAANVDEASKILEARWSELKMLAYLVTYIDATMNTGDFAQSVLDERDHSEEI